MTNKKINIMHIKSGVKIYGGEQVILNLAKNLNKNKFDNIIIANQNKKNTVNYFIKEAKKQDFKAEILYTIPKFNPLSISKLMCLIKKYDIDILHTHGSKENIIGFFAAKFLKIPIVATNHLKFSEDFKNRIKNYFDDIIMNYFDEVVCVSNELSASMVRKRIKPKKLKTIINGIDLTKFFPKIKAYKKRKEFNISKKDIIIGTISRLEIQKDHKTFLKAAKIMTTKFPKTRFLIVGDGSLKKELETFAKKLKISSRITFTGFRKDINEILNIIDIFVLTSLEEGTPIVLLEALAMKKPIIVTPVGGMPNIIKHKKTGLLVPIKNPKKITEAIEFLLKNPKEAKQMAENGRKLIEQKFSAERMAKEYEKIYLDIIQNEKH